MVRSCEEFDGYAAEKRRAARSCRPPSQIIAWLTRGRAASSCRLFSYFYLDNLGSSCQQLSLAAQIFTWIPWDQSDSSPVQPKISTWIAWGRAAGSCRLSSPDHRYRTQPGSCHVQNSWDPGSLLQVQRAGKQTSGAQSTISRSYEDSLNLSIITTALLLCLRGLIQC